jgi:glycosyltransferase involved in cell wall biosynthesis
MKKFVSRIHPKIRHSRISELALMVLIGKRRDIISGIPHIESVIGEMCPVHFSDYSVVMSIVKEVSSQLDEKIPTSHLEAKVAYDLCKKAFFKMPPWKPKKSIVMISAGFGCGAWRMDFPASVVVDSDVVVDVISNKSSISMDDYDVIRVQWLHDWVTFEALTRLKVQGKRIIIDLDDDLLSIPDSNPASNAIGCSSKAAILSIMSISDCVTVSTDIVAERMREELPQYTSDPVPIVVIPNSIDTRHGWRQPGDCFSKDGFLRIFWFGSNTHNDDWKMIIPSIDKILKERDNVRLVIWGTIPLIMEEYAEADHWKGRVEFQSGRHSEDFFKSLGESLVADIGIAPLQNNRFNQAKSNIKFIEYSLAGVPVVASDVSPYSGSISNDVDGILVSNADDWYDKLVFLLDNPVARTEMAIAARNTVCSRFDILSLRNDWRKAILGE